MANSVGPVSGRKITRCVSGRHRWDRRCREIDHAFRRGTWYRWNRKNITGRTMANVRDPRLSLVPRCSVTWPLRRGGSSSVGMKSNRCRRSSSRDQSEKRRREMLSTCSRALTQMLDRGRTRHRGRSRPVRFGEALPQNNLPCMSGKVVIGIDSRSRSKNVWLGEIARETTG